MQTERLAPAISISAAAVTVGTAYIQVAIGLADLSIVVFDALGHPVVRQANPLRTAGTSGAVFTDAAQTDLYGTIR